MFALLFPESKCFEPSSGGPGWPAQGLGVYSGSWNTLYKKEIGLNAEKHLKYKIEQCVTAVNIFGLKCRTILQKFRQIGFCLKAMSQKKQRG